MKAILHTKGGFRKEVEVPEPPPMEWVMAQMDESPDPDLNFVKNKEIPLYDIVVRQRVFRLVSVADPESAIRSLRMYNEKRRGLGLTSEVYFAETEYIKHYAKYNTQSPVAIYEEHEPMSQEAKERLVNKAYEIAKDEGLIKRESEIPVESVDNKRFIELDNEFQDL